MIYTQVGGVHWYACAHADQRLHSTLSLVFGSAWHNQAALQVETLFHEFGHAMNTLLCRNRLQHLSGARGPLDVVELPSHVLERAASQPSVLARLLAAHSEQDVRRGQDIVATRANSCRSMRALQSLVLPSIDSELHGASPPGTRAELQRIVQATTQQVLGLSVPEETYAGVSMNHVLTYGSLCHAYPYADAIADAVWRHHLQGRVGDRGAGDALAEALYVPGGVLDAKAALDALAPGAVVSVAGGVCPAMPGIA